jgi:undecaprenyl-diphosphatase
MIAASGFDLVMSASEFSTGQFGVLLIGFTASFLVAFAAIRLFLNYVKKHNLIPFGVYRILLVIVFYFLVIR